MMFFASLKMMLLPLVAMMRCLPNVPQGTHHSQSEHHSAKPSSFAEGKHHAKNAPLSIDKSAFFVGRGTRDRTQDTRFWRPHTDSLKNPDFPRFLCFKKALDKCFDKSKRTFYIFTGALIHSFFDVLFLLPLVDRFRHLYYNMVARQSYNLPLEKSP